MLHVKSSLYSQVDIDKIHDPTLKTWHMYHQVNHVGTSRYINTHTFTKLSKIFPTKPIEQTKCINFGVQ
jgi:hypothetical protein